MSESDRPSKQLARIVRHHTSTAREAEPDRAPDTGADEPGIHRLSDEEIAALGGRVMDAVRGAVVDALARHDQPTLDGLDLNFAAPESQAKPNVTSGGVSQPERPAPPSAWTSPRWAIGATLITFVIAGGVLFEASGMRNQEVAATSIEQVAKSPVRASPPTVAAERRPVAASRRPSAEAPSSEVRPTEAVVRRNFSEAAIGPTGAGSPAKAARPQSEPQSEPQSRPDPATRHAAVSSAEQQVVASPAVATPKAVATSANSAMSGREVRAAAVLPAATIASARQLLTAGEVQGARRIFAELQASSPVEAAFGLAQSYDPVCLGARSVGANEADIMAATQWYRRWEQLSIDKQLIKPGDHANRIIRTMQRHVARER